MGSAQRGEPDPAPPLPATEALNRVVGNLVVLVEERLKEISEMRVEIYELKNALQKVTSQEKERQEPGTEKVQKKGMNKMSSSGSHAWAKKDGDEGNEGNEGQREVLGGSAEKRENHQNGNRPQLDRPLRPRGGDSGNPKKCRFFQKRKCRNGEACRTTWQV